MLVFALALSACGNEQARPEPTLAEAAATAASAARSAPVITRQPASTAISAGATATFSVAATGDGLSYQWRRNGEPLAHAVAASYVTHSASTTDSGSRISVVVSNANGQVTSQDAVLTVADAMFTN